MNILRDRCLNAVFRVHGIAASYHADDGNAPAVSIEVLDMKRAMQSEWEGRELAHGQRVLGVKLNALDKISRGDKFDFDGLTYQVSGAGKKDFRRGLWICEAYQC